MRLFSALGYFFALICLPCCGHSPVSIEDDQELVHESFGFAIRPPEFVIALDEERMAGRAVEDSERRFQEMVDVHRSIIRTLRFTQ